MPGRLYLDTSAILRAVLERGTSPEVERQVRSATALLSSRLTTVETARALHWLRRTGERSEAELGDRQREISALLARCELWELSAAVCEMARTSRQVCYCAHSMRFIWRLSSWRASVSMASSC